MIQAGVALKLSRPKQWLLLERAESKVIFEGNGKKKEQRVQVLATSTMMMMSGDV